MWPSSNTDARQPAPSRCGLSLVGRRQSRCLLPLLSMTFQRLAAFAPPPWNTTGSFVEDATAAPGASLSVWIEASQLSSALVVHAVPLVGLRAAPLALVVVLQVDLTR